MKTKRQIAKENTYQTILEITEKLIEEQGVILLTTKIIAENASIAHGTVFAHFKNREELIIKVIHNKLLTIAKVLDDLDRSETLSLEDFLSDYLNLISLEEMFFSVLSKEFPFFSESVQKEILSTESIVRKSVYSKIEQGIKLGEYRQVNITMAISFLFATINYYLARKNYFIDGSKKVLTEKKESIINTFLSLLK